MSKKLFIETLGCAMNARDSEHIIAELQKTETFTITNDSKEADLIIINTCSVREKPVNKLFSEIGVFLKQRKKGAKIGVCGCTASHLGAEIFKRAPEVSFVLGSRNVSKITQAINEEKFLSVDIDHDESEYAFGEFRTNPYKAFINISIGCDKQCAFCIVPQTRGDEISIPSELILKEAEKVALNGAKEIFLLGQNVNNYGKRLGSGARDLSFAQLLTKLSEIDSLERIRFTSPHPLHMDDSFLEVFANNPKICKAMHMPLQSGSTDILKVMRRGYTKEWFLNRVRRLKELVPDVSISTDIIVAFPGESDEDFAHTLDVIEQVRFEQIFSFKYSPRPLTPAAIMTNIVDPEIGSERLDILQRKQTEILDSIIPTYQDSIQNVYFEELRADGYISGKSFKNSVVSVLGSEELLGTTRKVKITKPQRMALYGTLHE